jgi:hypothetical protein
MQKEKYLAEIDRVLISVTSDKSKSLGDKSSIVYSKELVDSGQIKCFAFDVYKVDNDPYQDLWVLEDVGGVPHLVRASSPKTDSTVIGDWSAVSDYNKENITLIYKSTPIARFSSDVYGFSSEDIFTFKSALLDRVGADSEFVKEVLSEQPANKREALAATHPEFKKFI